MTAPRESYLRGPAYTPTLHERDTVRTIIATVRADLREKHDERSTTSTQTLPNPNEQRESARRH